MTELVDEFEIIDVNVIANNDQNFNDHIEYQIYSKRYKDYEDALKTYRKILENQEKAELWDKLMTHSKYHNTFGCSYHFRVKKEIPELNRKIQFLQSESKHNSEIVERLRERLNKEKNFREYDDVYEALQSILGDKE